MILGDSHSKYIYYGFKNYFENKLNYIEIGIPSWSATFMPVGKNLNDALKQKEKIEFLFNLLKKIKFKNVLIVTRNVIYFKGNDIDSLKTIKFLNCFINKLCNNSLTYIEEMRKLISFLYSLKVKNIFYLFENPTLNFNPIFSVLNYKFPFNFLNSNENKTTVSFLNFYIKEKILGKIFIY